MAGHLNMGATDNGVARLIKLYIADIKVRSTWSWSRLNSMKTTAEVSAALVFMLKDGMSNHPS